MPDQPGQSAREEAVAGLRLLGWAPPKGWRFDREEANARGEGPPKASSADARSDQRPQSPPG